MSSHLLGLVLVTFGGILQGSFTLPMKFTPEWKWENTWFVYSISGLLLAPWIFAMATVPNLFGALAASDFRPLFAAMIFGIGWGVGAVLFGLGVARLGAALSFAIILGMTSAIGALAPLIVLHPENVFSPAGRLILIGVVLVVVALVPSARAGKIKEQATLAGAQAVESRHSFYSGLIICLLSGLTSPMLNFSLTFGAGIADEARRLGASIANANNAIWAPAVTAGAVVNVIYCVWLLARNRTGSRFHKNGKWWYWLLTCGMGFAWMGGIAAYGMGAAEMGQLGTSLGWPVFMSTIIITANIWGALTGEWKGAGPKAVRWMIVSVVILFVAIFTFAYSSTL